ncbi:serine/threonine-protein kinase/endoribonuclease IRE1a-like [Carya illinoinensis]|uniref:serine/threonine-protein kinase/endoribonuclease IRE1a-like n=1 Tax=Carya illinoinensis TaxID=32201 RepID=UPI001C723110|nr:serine/threonine-protein kinase/endoribonuclease IRE1a-like [Carya illinoinensis]
MGNPDNIHIFLQATKFAILENLSTTTKIESEALWVWGKPNTESMLTSSQGASEIGKGVYKPTLVYSDYSQYLAFNEKQATRAMIDYKARLESMKSRMSGINLWKANGRPSPLLLKMMRDVVSGLVHLHELGIIHRDLNPQNVLIVKERSLCAKLSNMGISKCLVGDMSSLSHHSFMPTLLLVQLTVGNLQCILQKGLWT